MTKQASLKFIIVLALVRSCSGARTLNAELVALGGHVAVETSKSGANVSTSANVSAVPYSSADDIASQVLGKNQLLTVLCNNRAYRTPPGVKGGAFTRDTLKKAAKVISKSLGGGMMGRKQHCLVSLEDIVKQMKTEELTKTKVARKLLDACNAMFKPGMKEKELQKLAAWYEELIIILNSNPE